MVAFLCFSLLLTSALCRAEVSVDNELVSYLLDSSNERPDDLESIQKREISPQNINKKMADDDSSRTKTYLEIEKSRLLEKLSREERVFTEFLQKYNRKYVNDTVEYAKRFRIFRKNLEFINELNENELGTAVYGVNKFSDISKEEFRAKYTGLRPEMRIDNWMPMQEAVIPDVDDLPDAFDWREKGAVTSVKNQGVCGSCWAFSTTGNIESQYQIKYGKLLSLSEQQLVDCDKLDNGCDGGVPDLAYKAIKEMGGLELESDYLYEGKDNQCRLNQSLAKVQVTSSVNISNNEVDMQKWLVKNGPISICLNSNAMQDYRNGVSHPSTYMCENSCIDHAVLLVGYGVEVDKETKKSMPYWIIKNSWGENWGENGYYRVIRGKGICGLNTMATSAIV